MPRTNYKGAFASESGVDPSTSKLVGSESEEDEMIARQMGSRLTKRLGIAIFISCSLEVGAPAVARDGVDEKLIQHRAAAIGEREIYRILKEKEEQQQQNKEHGAVGQSFEPTTAWPTNDYDVIK